MIEIDWRESTGQSLQKKTRGFSFPPSSPFLAHVSSFSILKQLALDEKFIVKGGSIRQPEAGSFLWSFYLIFKLIYFYFWPNILKFLKNPPQLFFSFQSIFSPTNKRYQQQIWIVLTLNSAWEMFCLSLISPRWILFLWRCAHY